MATAVKAASAGMTGAVRSLQWTIQDMNGSVEHLGQSHDLLRRAQNIMAWTTAIFGALLLSGLVWIANDIFHLKDQLMESDRRFDVMETQMTALGSRIDDLNISIEQLGAELLAARGVAPPATGPDVSILSTPNASQRLPGVASAPLDTTVSNAAAVPLQPQPAPAPVQQQVAVAPAQPAIQAQPSVAAAAPIPAVAPSPPAPRDQLTPQELAAPAPILAAVAPAAPAAPAPAATAPAAAQTQVAAAAPAAPLADLSDDQLLSFNDDQIDPADELLLLDENGNPQ